jgi:hypothetical protein
MVAEAIVENKSEEKPKSKAKEKATKATKAPKETKEKPKKATVSKTNAETAAELNTESSIPTTEKDETKDETKEETKEVKEVKEANQKPVTVPSIPPPPVPIKGRKTRGVKIISRHEELGNFQMTGPIGGGQGHVILHLKCSLEDLREYNLEKKRLFVFNDPLKYDPDVPLDPEIVVTSYNDCCDNVVFSVYEDDPKDDAAILEEDAAAALNPDTLCARCRDTIVREEEVKEMNTIHQKLRRIKIALYKNAVAADKTSACFWCAHAFDTPPCYIPQYEINQTYYGYGCFCCPECATAHLMKQGLDESTKFDRYHLINKIYKTVYEYKTNIRPAPDPHYLLNTFYGDLTIEEYRKLLKTPKVLFFVDKPMTRILPELHEEMVEHSSLGGQNFSKTGVYKVKRESEKEEAPKKTSLWEKPTKKRGGTLTPHI